MYAIGGHDGTVTVNTVFKYDSSNLWSTVTPMPAALYSMAACALGTHILVFGGIMMAERWRPHTATTRRRTSGPH